MTEDEIRAANPGKIRIYNPSTDEFVFATQMDVDRLSKCVTHLGLGLADIESAFKRLQDRRIGYRRDLDER
jgi:hypothetical protein